MRAISIANATFILAILPFQNVLAEGLLIKPHIDAGIMEYEFQQDTVYSRQFNVVQGKFHVDDLLPFGGVGVTAIYDRLFVDLYGQATGQGTDNGSQEVIRPSTFFEPSTGGKFRFDSTLENIGASATLGYRVIDNLTILAGYRYSATEINLENLTLSPIDGIVPFDSINNETRLDFTYHGPLFGLSYSVPIEQLEGALQFTTAGTYLFGNIDQRLKGAVSGTSKYGGNSVGYNVGISWTGRITDHLGYTLLADASKYDFNGSGDSSPDFSESIYRLRAQVGYSFDVGPLFGLRNL